MAINEFYPHAEGDTGTEAYMSVVMTRNGQNTAIEMAKALIDAGFDAGSHFYSPGIQEDVGTYGTGNCGACFMIDPSAAIGELTIQAACTAIYSARAPS